MKFNRSILVGAVACAGLGAVGFAFVGQASPYVDVATALHSKGDNLHVAGTLVPGSLVSSGFSAQFTLKDENGNMLPVLYQGEPLSDLATAPRVVAIGGIKQGTLISHQLLVKCPSKYESTPSTQQKA